MPTASAPPQMYLRNRVNGEKVQPQGNPPGFSGEVKVAYNRLKIPGLSHQIKQFSNTEDLKTTPIEFEYYGDTEKERDEIDRQFAIWQSWLLPEQADDIRNGAPPRLLLVWPNVFSLEVVITDFKFNMKEFTPEGDISWLVVTASFEEVSDERILPSLVKRVGLNRA